MPFVFRRQILQESRFDHGGGKPVQELRDFVVTTNPSAHAHKTDVFVVDLKRMPPIGSQSFIGANLKMFHLTPLYKTALGLTKQVHQILEEAFSQRTIMDPAIRDDKPIVPQIAREMPLVDDLLRDDLAVADGERIRFVNLAVKDAQLWQTAGGWSPMTPPARRLPQLRYFDDGTKPMPSLHLSNNGISALKSSIGGSFPVVVTA